MVSAIMTTPRVQLQEYYDKQGKDLNIKDLFVKDPKRFSKYRWVFKEI